ncbi:MAG: glycine cleavage system aminomethyltransferase GcvT [Deltaproteobacteria bacterium]|nr:glycine cleavage system aminomethyltransferase GcvT [Deltaproteobacteria bacterium]
MKKLPLHEQHTSLGARFGEFAGYDMPLYYTKPLEEHHTVRTAAGLFDISHMGQFQLSGPQAEDMLDYVLPNAVRTMADGDALYSPMLREDGGILDDLIIYRHDSRRFHIIVNGATKDKDLSWLQDIKTRFKADLVDSSEDTCLLAVQGPRVFGLLAPHLGVNPGALPYYSFRETQAFGLPVFLARTGYTGEPGCELSVQRKLAPELWRQLIALGITPIGLAARDTLRLEAAMSLYGHELTEAWHPLETGLGWTVHMEDKGDYIGRIALRAIQANGFSYRLVGLELLGRGIAREGYLVQNRGAAVGHVTSGALSPTLGKSIALARIRVESAAVGTAVQVEIRGRPVEALVVKKPFYKNPALKAQS